ncbi:MAG TPA: AbrB/MazE/SpoVT family DNA-binding domain-containing protein [Gammaproteobacteria bacterium]|nr:AbrB/MazE/SpoVT family DNA-binding domain-containing protein [Gammaproteobacteria bacterium]
MDNLTKKQMDLIARPLRTKADKIRALARANVAPADIARFLNIRYQHAYNVIQRAGLGDRIGESAAEPLAAAPISAKLDSNGCIELPESVRRAWGVTAGDEILLSLEGSELRLFTRKGGLRLAQGIVSRYLRPGESLADDLIRDRRHEAKDDA